MNDIDIMETLKINEEKGYELLIDKYTPYVSTIVYNMTSTMLTSSDMEEIVADVFFKIWKHRNHLKGDSLKGILISTTRNTCKDVFKKNRQPFVPLDLDMIHLSNPDTLHRIQEEKEQMSIVNEVVEHFTEPDKEIFIRFYYLGEKIKEISDFFQLNSSTVKTKLRRSRETLKQALNEGGYHYE